MEFVTEIHVGCGDPIRLASDAREGSLTAFMSALDGSKVTVVYTMHHHLGDFVVMGGLLRKFDLLGVPFESLVAHCRSPHVSLFDGPAVERFFDVGTPRGLIDLGKKLYQRRQQGRIILGVPMGPGSVQAHFFFRALKAMGALTHVVDFNLVNADVITPPRRRYIFDRHLAQAAEIFQRPEWLDDTDMPLALRRPTAGPKSPARRIGLFPWSGRRRLPEFCWPDVRWVELTAWLLEKFDGEVVLLGKDPAAAEFSRMIWLGLPLNLRARFVNRTVTTVPNLVASLREVDGLVTLNTSALHLAHALKLRTVALCGSSLECWLPESDLIRLVRDQLGVLPPSDLHRHDPLQPSLQHLELTEIETAVAEHLLS